MKLTCLQENLLRGLSIVIKAVPLKPPLPILSNVLLETYKGQLRLSATNLNTTITTLVGVSVDEEGSITVPARIFNAFVSNLSPTTLSMSIKNDVLHVKSERAKSRFNGINASEYPDLPSMPKGVDFLELDPKDFSASVGVVSFSASLDDSRPVLTGVLLTYDGKKLYLVGLDGNRLSEKSMELSSDVKPFSVIISAKTLSEIARVLSSASSPIKLALNPDDNLALFETDGTLIASSLLSGEFPDYKRIIPKDHTLTAEFSSSDLLEAVKLTNVFAGDTNIVKMAFDPKGFINISSSHEETGSNDSKIEAKVEGDACVQAFSSRYLLDLLSNVKEERFLFLTKGDTSPGVIRPLSKKDYTYVLAPMRVQA